MNFNKNIARILLGLILSTQICACKKFVAIDPPNNLLISSVVFEKDETAISSLTSIYSMMFTTQTLPYSISSYTGLYTDELKSYSTNTSIVPLYTNSLNSATSVTNNIWQTGYNLIYQANSVWEGCNTSNKLSMPVKKQLMAESRFIRAWWNFYLTNLYGQIPLVVSTDYNVNALLAASSQEEIYQLIISDLLYCTENLNENYVGGNSITSVTERVRPNKYVASALLAKVYLFHKEYSKAEDESTKVILKEEMYRLESLDNAFISTSREAIWQLMSTPESAVNTYEGFYYILTSKPSSGTVTNSAISSQLLASFESDDQRKVKWLGKYTDTRVTPNVTYYYPNKFKVKLSDIVTEYSMPLRLSDQYLIRAEARAQQNNIDGSKSDLDKIRIRSGLLGTTSNNKIDLISTILHEREVELFTEWGNRFFDLKRTEKIDQVMSVVSLSKGGDWNSDKKLWPIPQREVLNNPNMKQNPGYN